MVASQKEILSNVSNLGLGEKKIYSEQQGNIHLVKDEGTWSSGLLFIGGPIKQSLLTTSLGRVTSSCDPTVLSLLLLLRWLSLILLNTSFADMVTIK